MFDLAERSNFHSNLTDSVKMVISSHEMFLMRISLLTPFLSNDVKGSISTSFFNTSFINRVSDDLLIVLIDINDDVKGKMIFSHCHKDYNHLINYLLSLMNLILKLSENISIL